jgi:hypothetical protein
MSSPNPDAPNRPAANNDFGGARDALPIHEFADFHQTQLPEFLRERGGLAREDLEDLEPVALSEGGVTYTYVPSTEGFSVRQGRQNASIVVEFAEGAFSDFVNEIHSVSGLAMGGKLTFVEGALADLHRWEPGIRAVYTGRPIWTPAAAAQLTDESGKALDLGQTFTLDDSDDSLRSFLKTAGFVHVKSVFSEFELASLQSELERVRDLLDPGTGDCWWSTTSSGEQVVTRINYLDRWSEVLRDAGFDERIARLGRLLGPQFRYCVDRLDGPMAFIKNSNVAQGLGDLQWHQDDGLGGHPIMCPLMQVGLQLDAANARNGQIWVLAGSHEYTKHPMMWGDEAGKPVVRIVTEPGDVTVHYGDLFHTTPPPTGAKAGRRVLYFKFAEPKTFEAIPAGAHYNDLLFKAGEDGRVATRSDTWSEDDTQEEFESKVTGA